MKVLYLIILVLSFLIVFFLGFYLREIVISGRIVEDGLSKEYSFTRAICNENNKCIDVFVKCLNGEVEEMTPVSGFVSFPFDWEDPRGNLSEFCK